MSYEEALVLSEELKGHLINGVLSSYSEEVKDLYRTVFGKEIRKCNCKDRYSDALIEVINYLKFNNKMKEQTTAKLKRGVVIQIIESGEVYTNANLTDEVARQYIENYPDAVKLFEKTPETHTALNENLVSEILQKVKDGILKKDIKESYSGTEYEGEKLTARRVAEYIKAADSLIETSEGDK